MPMSTNDMYDMLLGWENESKGFEKRYPQHDIEDAEIFMTSKEIAKQKRFEESGGTGSYQHHEEPEVLHFKKYNKRREHKYTEHEMELMRASCKNTIVHDYGNFDWYHISDKERKENDQLSEISLQLAKLKRTYRRVDQYIEAMRVVFHAWNLLSKMNFIHTKKEFFSMISKGKIISNRIIMPKLKAKGSYNVDLLAAYIANPHMDVSHLAPKKQTIDDIFLSDEEAMIKEKEIEMLISPEEAKYVEEHKNNPESLHIEYIKPKYIKGYSNRNLKRRKKESKSDFKFRKSLAESLKRIENSSHYKDFGRSYMITHSLFEVNENREMDFWEKFPFTGKWTSKNDAYLYNLATEAAMLNETPPRERYLTYADKNMDSVFRAMEDQGVSTIELRRRLSADTTKTKEKVKKKENKKLEAAIINRIEKLNVSREFKKLAKKAEEALGRYEDGTSGD